MPPVKNGQGRRLARGFMMFEALVTLAIIAVTIAAISGLYASALRGLKFAQERSVLLRVLTLAAHDLPAPDHIAPGRYSGATSMYIWQADAHILPEFQNIGPLNASSPVLFVPLEVTITAATPTGQSLQLTTLRFMRRRGR